MHIFQDHLGGPSLHPFPISATGGAFSQNITRAYSKLKAAFITFRPTKARVKDAGLWTERN